MDETGDSENLMGDVVEITGVGGSGRGETTPQLNDVVVFRIVLLVAVLMVRNSFGWVDLVTARTFLSMLPVEGLG